MSKLLCEVTELTEVDGETVARLNQLVAQLSKSARALDIASYREIASSPTCHLLVARSGGEIAGMLTLVVFPLPTGRRAWIEDVVVDDRWRGHGIGRHLTESALDMARELGARTVDLTSRASRVAANALYQSVGFELRQTNVYRFGKS
ncbi:MAG: GNAT family N-acetyltransferase [Ferrimicrobium sp.]